MEWKLYKAPLCMCFMIDSSNKSLSLWHCRWCYSQETRVQRAWVTCPKPLWGNKIPIQPSWASEPMPMPGITLPLALAKVYADIVDESRFLRDHFINLVPLPGTRWIGSRPTVYRTLLPGYKGKSSCFLGWSGSFLEEGGLKVGHGGWIWVGRGWIWVGRRRQAPCSSPLGKSKICNKDETDPGIF